MSGDYYNCPELGLNGKWTLEKRLEGLEPLLKIAGGKTVLDLGCAEGLVAREFLKHGAEKVIGFDFSVKRLEKAYQVCSDWPDKSDFHYANFNKPDIFRTGCERNIYSDLDTQLYDIVLYLGVHHHLQESAKNSMLEYVFSVGTIIAVRIEGKLKIYKDVSNGDIA